MKTTYHMSTNIEGLLRNMKGKKINFIDDENGNTMGYVFIGEAIFKENEGEKPMNIKWELNEPIPNYLWKESAKMSID